MRDEIYNVDKMYADIGSFWTDVVTSPKTKNEAKGFLSIPANINFFSKLKRTKNNLQNIYKNINEDCFPITNYDYNLNEKDVVTTNYSFILPEKFENINVKRIKGYNGTTYYNGIDFEQRDSLITFYPLALSCVKTERNIYIRNISTGGFNKLSAVTIVGVPTLFLNHKTIGIDEIEHEDEAYETLDDSNEIFVNYKIIGENLYIRNQSDDLFYRLIAENFNGIITPALNNEPEQYDEILATGGENHFTFTETDLYVESVGMSSNSAEEFDGYMYRLVARNVWGASVSSALYFLESSKVSAESVPGESLADDEYTNYSYDKNYSLPSIFKDPASESYSCSLSGNFVKISSFINAILSVNNVNCGKNVYRVANYVKGGKQNLKDFYYFLNGLADGVVIDNEFFKDEQQQQQLSNITLSPLWIKDFGDGVKMLNINNKIVYVDCDDASVTTETKLHYGDVLYDPVKIYSYAFSKDENWVSKVPDQSSIPEELTSNSYNKYFYVVIDINQVWFKNDSKIADLINNLDYHVLIGYVPVIRIKTVNGYINYKDYFNI